MFIYLSVNKKNNMLNGISRKDYPKIFQRILKDFSEVLMRKTSLKLYLTFNYPIFVKLNLKTGEVLRWKGVEFKVPPIVKYPQGYLQWEPIFIMAGKYSTKECSIKPEDIVLDVGAHFGFFSYYAFEMGAKEVYLFEPNPWVFEILNQHISLWSDKIKPYQLALSDKNGKICLFISEEMGSTSTILKKDIIHV